MLNHLQNEFNKSSTANEAFAYKSTKSAVLDLFALGGAYRNRSDEDVVKLFSKAFAENPLLAMKTLFYLRDIREGQGERRFFKLCLQHLATHNKDALLKNLHLVPEFGRWDDILPLLETSVKNSVVDLIASQLTKDIESDTPSLLAKWLPSENASSLKTKKYARILREALDNIRRYCLGFKPQWFDNDQRKARKLLEDLKAVGEQLQATGHNMTRFNREMAKLDPTGKGLNLNTKDIEMQLDAYTRMLRRKKAEIRNAEKELRLGEDITSLVNQKFGSNGIIQLQDLIKSKDIQGLQEFIGKIYGARVATVSLKNDGVDPTGRAVTKLITTFESAGKSARRVSLTMAEGTNTLRQASEEMVYNANRNLGVFEQLNIAMARVPVWMTAMTAFYGSINAVSAMVNEILQLDKALTELKRVANDNLSIDTLFQGAVRLSSELGNNIHDVMASLNDFARTFGDFNERQLLAITKTATLMANVSDLSAQEAAENLVGTMNAFNITAEESIHIVDALNEVDNNFAISTKQLAEGLSKSASTAKTFGVTMEENVGHITAIGAVTMESGSIIGNSLKTIYSRITTLKDARQVLQSVGVAITQIGKDGQETVRPVSDILEDLAKRWNVLSDAERQNIAVKVAGRYQLSRFLALMNNYEMATKATETAIYSQGSAMRENAEYLKSFEARLNTLKNGFTELSNAVGDAVLSDGMMAVIAGLGALAKAAITVTQNFGALPVVFGAVSFILARMGAFSKVTDVLTEGFTAFNAEMKRTMATTGGIRGALAGASAGFGALTTTIRGATAATRTFSIAWKAMLAETVIGVAFVALGVAIEKLTSYMADQKRKAEELEKLNNKMVQSYRQHADGMKSLIARYEELSNKQNKTKEEQKEYERLQKELASSIPTVVQYVDANGKAHLKNVDAIKKEVQAVADLSREQAKLTDLKYAENISKQAEAYEDVLKKIEELKAKQRDLQESDGKLNLSAGRLANYGITTNLINDNTKAIQQSKVEVMMAEAEKTEAIKKTIKVIQEQTLAHLEASGKLSSLGDAQQAVIEKFIQSNESMLRGAENAEQYKAKVEELFNLGTTVGNVFVQAFQQMSAGLGDDPLQLEKIKEQLSAVATALPEDFFVLDKNRTVDVVAQQLQNILNISNQIAQGSTDWNGLVAQLQSSGLTAEQAGGFIARLAREHDNAKLRAMAQAQGIEELTGSLEDLNQKALETIDVTEALFGFKSKDLSAIKSHIEALEIMKQVYGENASRTVAWKNSISQLADALGVTETEIASNLHYYNQVIDALQKVKVKTDEYGNSTLDLSDLNKHQKAIMQEWIATARNKGLWMNILTGETEQLVSAEQNVTDATANMKQGLQGLNSVVINQPQNQLNNLGNQADTAKGKVEGLRGLLITPFISPTLNQLLQKYQNLGTQADTASSKVDNLNNNLKSVVFIDPYSKWTGAMSGLNSALDDTSSKAQTTKNNVSNVVQGGVALAQVNQQMQGTQQAAQNANTAVSGVNQQLDQTGQKAANLTKVKDGMQGIANASQGITLDQINAALTRVGSIADSVRGKINQFIQTLSRITSTSNTAGSSLNNYINTINRLASTFTKSSSSAKTSTSSITSIANAFRSGATNAKAYTDAVNKSVSSSTKSANASKQNASAKRAEATAFAQSAARIREVSGSYNSMATISASASAKIRSALNQQRQAITQLQQAFSRVASTVSKAFSSMASTVKSRTSAMISSHNSQRSAINNLASAARSAKSAVDSLNSSARSAMATLNSYIARARAARSAGSSVPAVPSVRANSYNIAPTSENVASAMSAFTASAGEAVEASAGGGGGDTGTSGILRTSIYAGGINLDGGYTFTALDLAPKVTYDPEERKMTVYEGIIRKNETILQRMIKANAEYRDILKSIIYYENLKLQVAKQDLVQTQDRNDWVNKRLSQLNQMKKHTEAQREEYNKLQQEYEQNLSKIASLQVEIESLTNSIHEHNLEVFTDFIDEIVAKYDEAIEAIKGKVDDFDFEIDVLTLTQPENIKDLLNVQIEKAKELQKQQAQEANKVKALTDEYESAKKKYGADSKQAKAVEEALNKAREAYEESVLAVLNAEKEIKETRGKIADEGIKQVQEYYKNMKSMALDAIEAEQEALKKAYDEKMKMYDEEIDKINSVYDEKLKAMDREKDQAEYQEQLDKKNAKKAELLNKISLLSRDNSLEGRKKLEELKKELTELEEEIMDFQRERQEELLRQSIEDQKKQQIEAINAKKEEEKKLLDSQLGELDAEKEAVSKRYDDLLNNDKYWADMRNNYIKGSFELLDQELAKMKESLDLMNQGIFDGLTNSFATFSEEVKKKIAELNELLIDNMLFNSGDAISGNEQVKQANPYDYSNGAPTKGTPPISKPEDPEPPRNPSMFRVLMPNGEYIDTAVGTTLYKLLKQGGQVVAIPDNFRASKGMTRFISPDGKFVDTAVAKTMAQLLAKGYLKLMKFDTGGYTGTWAGNDGKLAVLHKKELVLNERQTSDILNTAKILDRLKNFIPAVSSGNIAGKLATVAGMKVTNINNLTVNIDNLNGTREDANMVVREIMKGLRKMGK